MEWYSYFCEEPFGEERGDLRMGVLASLYASAHRDPKSSDPLPQPADFMPRFGISAKEREREKGAATGSERKPMTSKSQWKSFVGQLTAASLGAEDAVRRRKEEREQRRLLSKGRRYRAGGPPNQ